MNSPLLEARDIAVRRGQRMLFSAVSLRLDGGQALELRGVNGSGKTSLLRVLAGLGMAAAGELYWRGAPVSADPVPMRADLIYVGHAAALKAELTAIENLAFLSSLHGLRLQRSHILQALKDMGLSGEVTRLPCRQLSAGQKRRVVLARLLLVPVALWLLDEPLAALDGATSRRFEQLMRDHLERGGMIVVATHGDIDLGSAPVLRLMVDR